MSLFFVYFFFYLNKYNREPMFNSNIGKLNRRTTRSKTIVIDSSIMGNDVDFSSQTIENQMEGFLNEKEIIPVESVIIEHKQEEQYVGYMAVREGKSPFDSPNVESTIDNNRITRRASRNKTVVIDPEMLREVAEMKSQLKKNITQESQRGFNCIPEVETKTIQCCEPIIKKEETVFPDRINTTPATIGILKRSRSFEDLLQSFRNLEMDSLKEKSNFKKVKKTVPIEPVENRMKFPPISNNPFLIRDRAQRFEKQ